MDEDITDLPVPTKIDISDLPAPSAQDMSRLPVSTSTKKEPGLLEKGTEVVRQGLIGGIAGGVFP
jgi:hypothetical protein